MNDRSAPDARDAGARRQLLRSARKHGAALASETVSPVDLPPVRLGLLTKIQVLAVALVFVTAVAITGYTFWREWSGGEDELRAQALTLSTMLAEVVDEPLAARDRGAIEQVISTLAPGANIAYVAVLDAKGGVVAARRYAEQLGNAPIPAIAPGAPSAGSLIGAQRRTIGQATYLEVVAPVRAGRSFAARTPSADPPAAGPVPR